MSNDDSVHIGPVLLIVGIVAEILVQMNFNIIHVSL